MLIAIQGHDTIRAIRYFDSIRIVSSYYTSVTFTGGRASTKRSMTSPTGLLGPSEYWEVMKEVPRNVAVSVSRARVRVRAVRYATPPLYALRRRACADCPRATRTKAVSDVDS
jgi:hypothetical protein